jgi:hypothetical protein
MGERDNHIATDTSPQPRGGTTPASSWEAATSMKMAPGALPRPGRVPEQRLLSPELGFWMAAELGRVSGKILRCLWFLGQEATYRRRGFPRGGPPLSRRVEGARGPYPMPSSRPLNWWLPSGWFLGSVFVPGKNWPLWIFRSFREYFQNNFSETKNRQKTWTDTGHLVNRLVRENALKWYKTMIKTSSNGIKQACNNQKL